MNILLRKAAAIDWKIIQELNSQVFQNDKDNDPDLDLNWPHSETGLTYYKQLADGSYGHCIIAEENSIVIGYIALAKKTFGHRKSKYVEVENIGVRPEFRASGTGTLLMNAAADWAKEQGAKKLYVQAFSGNEKAINFYKKNDFVEIGVEMEKEL